jgi:transposase
MQQILSDHNSTPYSPGTGEPGVNNPEPDAQWVRNMIESLRFVTPRLFDERYSRGLEASVYTGLTSEREFGGGTHRADYYVDTLGLRNLATIWPTKLTLIPLASDVGTRIVQNEVPRPSAPWHSGQQPSVGERPGVAQEMWTRGALDADAGQLAELGDPGQHGAVRLPSQQPRRRSFTADYKLAMIAEYDAATEPDAKGALPHGEGLHSSHIIEWRRARDAGALAGVGTRRVSRPAATQIGAERLRAENERLRTELAKTRAALDVVGKAHALLG